MSEFCVHFKGNAVTTVKSKDPIKVFTVRGTTFEAATDGADVSSEDGKKVKQSLEQYLNQWGN